MWKAVMLVALLGGCASHAPARVVEPRPAGGTQARDPGLLGAVMIAKHNEARRAVGAPPLQWDMALAADALGYASELARTRRFRHAEQKPGPGYQGENLFTGTRGAYGYDEMVQFWIDEKKWFVNRAAPDFSTTGRGGDVGHYTQMIWRTTTRFGCALASSKWDDYLVCRYTPGGNVIGQKTL